MTYVTDKIKIEVEIPQPTGLQNLVWNPNAELGSWGWETPTVGTALSSDANGSNNTPGTRLQLSNSIAQVATAYSNRFAIAANEWARGAITVVNSLSSTNYYRLYFSWIDANGVTLGTSTVTSYINLVNGTTSTVAVQAPANTVEAVFAVAAYGNNAGGNFAIGQTMYFNNAMVAKAATSGALSTFIYQYPYTWQDITSKTYDIDIETAPLDTGTCNISLMDPALDPSISNVLKPGKRIRVSSNISGTYEPVFTGKIVNARTNYQKAKGGSLTDRGAVRVLITAADALSQLSNQPEPKGVGDIVSLRNTMENKGVPWNISVNRGQNFTDPTVNSLNPNASMLDQIAVTTDTTKTFAWIDRYNVVNVWSASDFTSIYGAAGVVNFQDDAGATISYTDIDVQWNIDEIVNVITYKYQRYNPGTGGIDEVTYGPYSDSVSVTAYGAKSREYTVGGPSTNDNDAYWKAQALAVFAVQATPTVMANSLTMKVTNATELQWATRLGLFTPIDIEYDVRLDSTQRIVGIKHSITNNGKGDFEWHVTYELNQPVTVRPSNVRRAGITDGLGLASDTLGWIRPGAAGGPTWGTGWADNNAATAEPAVMQKVGGVVRVRGLVWRTSGAGVVVMTLPADCRPSKTLYRPSLISNSWAYVSVAPNGDVSVAAAGAAIVNSAVGIGLDIEFDLAQP